MSTNTSPAAGAAKDADAELLASMGYKQELKRHMGGFSNFAISFSIICILAGGITAFPQAIGAGGGLSVGLGWPVGAFFALVVAAGMAQIASAFPTAGGLYHWSSALGGKGWGWATAWFNLLGLIFVVASVNFGVFDPFFKMIAPYLGLDPTKFGTAIQIGFIALVTVAQVVLNSYAPRLTTKLTDISGYLIFAVAALLVVSLLIFTPSLHFGRLLEFTNMTGADGSSWPHSTSTLMIFLSGLLLTVYTITGFDASAHTSEETHDAARVVPKGIITSVAWSALFGFIMICTFVAAMPALPEAVKSGFGFLATTLAPVPASIKALLAFGIFLANFLCGLAGLTSTSRMMYAFARDGGLPASDWLKTVDEKTQTPVRATWVAGILVVAATLYGDAFVVLSAGCAVFLYLSYVMPIAAGFFAEGKSWTVKGPFDLKAFSKPIAVLAVVGGMVLAFVGMQPPNQKVFYIIAALSVLLLAFWWVFGLRKSFVGPQSLLKHDDSASDAVEGELVEG